MAIRQLAQRLRLQYPDACQDILEANPHDGWSSTMSVRVGRRRTFSVIGAALRNLFPTLAAAEFPRAVRMQRIVATTVVPAPGGAQNLKRNANTFSTCLHAAVPKP